MDTLYPNLYERFKTEGLCPICLMEMELTPRYSCINRHTVCHRCKPYYYNCPTCRAPLDVEILPPHGDDPPPPHMPHRRPSPHYGSYHTPSAPAMHEHHHDHGRRSWEPPVPSEDHHIRPCSYFHAGCWVKVPEHLRTLHESRCQFRPHLEDEHLPTDLRHADLVECMYSVVGCNVQTAPWRKSIHESICIYKDSYEGLHDINEGLASTTISDHHGDPEELLQCRFRSYGCMVKMPRRRKLVHELKCNYKDQQGEPEDQFHCSFVPEVHAALDPEEPVECRWSDRGCRIKPKRCRKCTHEEKCNYRMEECAFGCGATFIPAMRYAHQRTCDFAN